MSRVQVGLGVREVKGSGDQGKLFHNQQHPRLILSSAEGKREVIRGKWGQGELIAVKGSN